MLNGVQVFLFLAVISQTHFVTRDKPCLVIRKKKKKNKKKNTKPQCSPCNHYRIDNIYNVLTTGPTGLNLLNTADKIKYTLLVIFIFMFKSICTKISAGIQKMYDFFFSFFLFPPSLSNFIKLEITTAKSQ